MFRWIFVSIFLFAATLPATAKTHSVTVPANRTSAVLSFHLYIEANCYYPSDVKSDVTRQGEHGTIKVVYKRLKIPDEARTRCAGQTAGALIVTYTPKRGYRGEDSARIVFRYPRYEGAIRTKSDILNLKITVK